MVFDSKWRKGRDSNPRYGHPHTRFPSMAYQFNQQEIFINSRFINTEKVNT